MLCIWEDLTEWLCGCWKLFLCCYTNSLRKHLLSYCRQADLNLMLLCVSSNVEQAQWGKPSSAVLTNKLSSVKQQTVFPHKGNRVKAATLTLNELPCRLKKNHNKLSFSGWPYLGMQLLDKPVNTKASSVWHAALSQVYVTHTSSFVSVLSSSESLLFFFLNK